MIYSHFCLDIDAYIGRPGMSLDIFLYKTRTKLELLQDIDMIHFFEDAVKVKLKIIALINFQN